MSILIDAVIILNKCQRTLNTLPMFDEQRAISGRPLGQFPKFLHLTGKLKHAATFCLYREKFPGLVIGFV